MIGFMAGAGIVVRNSIILVDFIEQRLRENTVAAVEIHSADEVGLVLARQQDRAGAGTMSVLRNYLLDIQPGFIDDPSNGVYNRAWLLGDEKALSAGLQAEIDKLCEIVQITAATGAVGGTPTDGG